MANYATLKATIQQYIKQNGENAITGNLLQQQLLAMINSLGAGFQFMGVADTTTNPGTPDQNVFYIAIKRGIYANFDSSFNLTNVSILAYNGTWYKMETGIPFGDEINTKVFTNGKGGANNVIRLFFLDTSGYTGTTPLTGLRIRTLSNGWGDLWGFSLENGDGTLIFAPWESTNKPVISGTRLGIYYYGAFNWDNMTSGGHIDGIELTAECYKEYNDPRINIPDGSVTTPKIADGAVTTSKVADGSITNEKADGRLLEPKLINAISGLQYDIKDFVLNKYISGTGAVNSLRGWGYTPLIPILPNTTISMNTNTLGYVVKYKLLYDADKNVISNTFGAVVGNIIDCDVIISSKPTAKYITVDIIDPTESGPGTTDLTPTNTADWVLCVKSKYAGQFDSLEPDFINAIGRLRYDITQIGLNAYINPRGNLSSYVGWGYVRFIPLIPNTTITMGSNTLGYVIKYRALYDKDKQFISGTFAALGGATTIDCDSVIASYPAAKYIGVDLIDPAESGSGSTELTPTNTADWVVIVKSKYDDEITDLDNRVTELENGGGLNKKNTFVFSSGESYVISPFDATNNLKTRFRITRAIDNTQNPCFNFTRVELVNKTTLAETLVHSCSDDICPGKYNGTYIGANHGQDATTVTAANHGKTYADIGSKWTDGTHNFYIVAILGTDEIQMLSDNQSTYPRWSFIMPSVGTLTHVSGATHTGDITITARATSQMRPIMSLQSTKIIADDEEITEPGTYHFNTLKISQIYDVRNSASVLAEIIGRVGQFTANPIYSQLGADKVMRHSITYEYKSAQECTITTDFFAYQNVNLEYFGFTQQSPLSGDNVKMYIPKALPISNGQTTLDFRTIAPHNSVPSTMNITTQYWENAQLPPDRWIQFADNISFVGGYLFDKGVGGNERKNVIDNAFFLYTSRKCYPHGIDSKITLSGGQSFSAVNIRKYIPAVSGSIPPYVFTTFEYNGELYVYFDAWSTGIHSVSIPDKFINGALTIFEKSANVEMLSSTVNSEMLLSVTSATPMYGYLVGKIKI